MNKQQKHPDEIILWRAYGKNLLILQRKIAEAVEKELYEEAAMNKDIQLEDYHMLIQIMKQKGLYVSGQTESYMQGLEQKAIKIIENVRKEEKKLEIDKIKNKKPNSGPRTGTENDEDI